MLKSVASFFVAITLAFLLQIQEPQATVIAFGVFTSVSILHLSFIQRFLTGYLKEKGDQIENLAKTVWNLPQTRYIRTFTNNAFTNMPFKISVSLTCIGLVTMNFLEGLIANIGMWLWMIGIWGLTFGERNGSES